MLKETIADNIEKIAVIESGFPVTTSSDYDSNHTCHNCRINQIKGRVFSNAWCASVNDENQWIQVNVIIPKLINILNQSKNDEG